MSNAQHLNEPFEVLSAFFEKLKAILQRVEKGDKNKNETSIAPCLCF